MNRILTNPIKADFGLFRSTFGALALLLLFMTLGLISCEREIGDDTEEFEVDDSDGLEKSE